MSLRHAPLAAMFLVVALLSPSLQAATSSSAADPVVVIEADQSLPYCMPGSPCVVAAAPVCGTVIQPSCDCAAPVYGSCGETVCDCCCGPLWTFRAEALIWERTSGDNIELIDTAGAEVEVDDFDFGFRAGPRLTAIRHGIFGSAWDAELVYFGIDGWEETLLAADADVYLTTPTIFIAGGADSEVTYDSALYSAELNFRTTRNDWVTWLVGFRWVQVSEGLTNDIGGFASHEVETINHLYGGQVGADILVWDGGIWTFNSVLKAGIYGNNADMVTTTDGIGGALAEVSADDSETAFVGEINFNLAYHLNDRWSAIGGYSLLWIDGIALAPEQLETTNIATGDAIVNTDGDLFYHGANVGLEYSW